MVTSFLVIFTDPGRSVFTSPQGKKTSSAQLFSHFRYEMCNDTGASTILNKTPDLNVLLLMTQKYLYLKPIYREEFTQKTGVQTILVLSKALPSERLINPR